MEIFFDFSRQKFWQLANNAPILSTKGKKIMILPKKH
jgi:hypothetical protein